jgi:hypothetical protein
VHSLVSAKLHFGVWSLLPALVAVTLCLLTKEPLSALFGGIVVGGFMLGRFNITNDSLLPNLATESADVISVVAGRIDGYLVAHRRCTGFCSVYDQALRTRTPFGQAGRLEFGRDISKY